MNRTDVYHARDEKVQRGKPLYHGRPSRMADETLDAEVRTVATLGSSRITALHEASPTVTHDLVEELLGADAAPRASRSATYPCSGLGPFRAQWAR